MQQRSRKRAVYLVLAFGLSWTIVGVYLALGGRASSPAAAVVAVAYMLMPAVAAVAAQRVAGERVAALAVSFRVNRWFLVGWLMPPVLAAAAFGASLLVPGVTFSPSMEGMFDRFAATMTPQQVEQMRGQIAALPVHPFWLALAQGLVAGATVNAVAGFGEELGWRGLLQGELAGLGFWRCSLVTGAAWGLWHAPLILQGHNYPQHPVAGVAMMTGWCLLLAPLFAYVRLKSGSVIAAALMHGSLNGTAGLSFMLLAGGSDLTVGITGIAGFVVLALANAALFVYDRLFER